MEFLVLVLLLIKHFIADLPLQTLDMIKSKGTLFEWDGITHSLIHGLLTFTVSVLFFGVSLSFILAIIDFVVHYAIDFGKVQLDKKLECSKFENGNTVVTDTKYYYLFVGDQCLHFLTYILLA